KPQGRFRNQIPTSAYKLGTRMFVDLRAHGALPYSVPIMVRVFACTRTPVERSVFLVLEPLYDVREQEWLG
ncbi:hypothetical protein LCGC14_1496230, partial [marine sediment metagenome]